MPTTYSNPIALRIALCLAALGSAVPAEAEPEWSVLVRERGVEVSVRDEPGSSLPSFRGVATLRGAVLHVLAVVLDDARSREWAASVTEAQVLRVIDERTLVVYSRSNMPWPVRDRDLVMKRVVEIVEPNVEYLVRLACMTGERPPKPDAVRITRCSTSFRLRRVDGDHTRVDYRVHAEPGGNNPAWIVRMASRSIPLDTLVGLQRQIDRTRGEYADAMRRWATAR